MRAVLFPSSPLLLVLPILTATLGAQVSPAVQAKMEGNNAAVYPIGFYQTNAANRLLHYQQVHDDVTIKSINSMGFRRDSKGAYFYDVPAFWADIQVALSTAATTAATMSNTYASNEGNDRKVVLSRTKVNFPAAVKFHNVVPQPLFSHTIKFSNPFVWTTPKSLCWDLQLYDSNLHTVTGEGLYLDAVNLTASKIPGFNLEYGRGCFSSNPGVVNSAQTVSAFSIDPRKPQLTLNVNGCNFTPRSVGFAMLGLSRTTFRSQNLPLDLTPLGAPGCSLLQSWDVQVPVTMDFKGNLGNCASTAGRTIITIGNTTPTGLNINAPHATALEGLTLFTQIYTVDAKANSLGIVTGHASQAMVPLSYLKGIPANRVFRAGSTALTNANGTYSAVAPWATIVSFN